MFTPADGNHASSVFGGVCVFVCLSIIHKISKKPTQLGSSNLTKIYVQPRVQEIHLFWGQKVKVITRTVVAISLLNDSYLIHFCRLVNTSTAPLPSSESTEFC